MSNKRTLKKPEKTDKRTTRRRVSPTSANMLLVDSNGVSGEKANFSWGKSGFPPPG